MLAMKGQRFTKVLILDVGNTSVDACLFEKNELIFLGKFAHEKVEELKGDYDKVYIASVKPSLNFTLMEVFKNADFITHECVPLRASFDTRKVGIDRLLNLYGALSFYSDNALVVSSGTALVLDALVDGVFEGGFISLGLSGKLRCLSERAELVPYINLEKVQEVFLGRDTKTALLGGIMKEAKSFIKAVLEELKTHYFKEFSLIITGGDGWLLEDLGTYDPLLLHKAILRIYKLL